MKVYFDDPGFDGQLLRALAYTYYGGADLGECLTTAQRITPGDVDSWYAEWTATADRVYGIGEAAQAAGRRVSAREAYLRASNYYRTAGIQFYRPPLDSRLVAATERQSEAFQQAAALFSSPVERVAIPYEGTTLPGYLFLVDDSGAPRPTLVFVGGYDGTAEESYFALAAAGLRRGYHCLSVDGPGQGTVLIRQEQFMRPDWERVVTPTVDYALARREIDERRIALVGRSWGGYLAPRAATAEHRVAACIADPGLYSPGSMVTTMFPPELARQLDSGNDQELQQFFAERMKMPGLAFQLNRGMLVHGCATPLDYVRAFRAYTLEGIAGQIRCPTLIAQAENDTRASQSHELYDALTCPKELIEFTNAEGAGEHCEAGADSLFHQRAFDWLDGVLARA